MKFNFKIQDYQTDAVNSIVKVFEGQGYHNGTKYIRDIGSDANQQTKIDYVVSGDISDDDAEDIGYKNEEIQLSDTQLLENIRNQQALNNIKQSAGLVNGLGRCNLDIEMETGTGKTYVYIKTMFELNKRYGWSKFIVVVPSIAIREGVKKSFEITVDHFMEHYGKKARFFIYNSSNLNQLDSFSTSSEISVMIINTQAFARSFTEAAEGKKQNKEQLIIYSKQDDFGSRRPIDVIKANHPILILDEPQKMGGKKTQDALQYFNPLFSLYFSATHSVQHNSVYELDAADAFNRKLVKRIEVKGFEVKNLRGTDKYMFLEQIIISEKSAPMARLEFEVSHKTNTKRESHIVKVHDDLYSLSNNMEQYKGFVITNIDPINNNVEFLNGETITTGNVIGDVSESDIRRIQIRETILSHFEKEEKLFRRGIKTLSLFFIDEVAKYRQYDEDGNEVLGEYGKIFEEEYMDILNDYINFYDSDYQDYLKTTCSDVSKVHNGYFSIDKKTGHSINGETKRGTEDSDDVSAYELILKKKERLLSFDEPTRFIFSHSALREGWDNPNVFQICTLKHADSTTAKRQEVGRGLRLCVNQDGSRMDEDACGKDVHDINLLTVVASESYKTFVESLQSDIKAALRDRPTKATMDYFTGKIIYVDGEQHKISSTEARKIYNYLIRNYYIDDITDEVSDEYRTDLANGTLASLPPDLKDMTNGIHLLIRAIFDDEVLNEMISNGNETKVRNNPLNENFYKREFQTLWNYLNHKYTYTVKFDSEELIKKSIISLNANLNISSLMYTTSIGRQKAEMKQDEINDKESFRITKTRTQTLRNTSKSSIKYDLIGKVASGTLLTRKTVAAILSGMYPEQFMKFRENPEEFINKAIRIINEQKATMIVEHISYNQTNDMYDSSIFTAEKTAQSFEKVFSAKKAVQDYIFTDGYAKDGKSVERTFLENLDVADEVCVYAKLPRGFSIPTPVGNYSPDWAIAFNENLVKHIYFVAETKGSMTSLEMREIERAKIDCAKRLFDRMSTSKVKYDVIKSYQNLMEIVK